VGINRIDRQNRVGNVGYWVRTQATGRGVATTAVRLAARVGFEQAGLRRLEFLVSVENEASQRVAEKVGARREGVLRRRLRVRERVDDAFLYALLPDDLAETHRRE
jgi:Acetyltransferases, including N-acetylases of ribosomal proteins